MHENLTDAALYALCKKYGLNAKQWLRKFAGLLPEVYRRQLYKHRSYGSIYEFAAKLAGMSETQVDKIIYIARKLEGKPALKSLLETGEIGWSKIEKVAYIATPETDKFWVEKVRSLPAATLELYVQKERKSPHMSETQPAKWKHISFPISPELKYLLKKTQQELEKEKSQKMSINEVLLIVLKNYKTPSYNKAAQKVIQICPTCVQKCEKEKMEARRPIPTAVQNLVRIRQDHRCAFPRCNQPGRIFHHTRRFALVPNHDPAFIVYLCTAHERLAHTGLIGNEQDHPSHWYMRSAPDYTASSYQIDQKVAVYRREPDS